MILRFWALLLFAGVALVQAGLPAKLEKIVSGSGLDRSRLSILIAPTGGSPIASLNPDTERIPASVIKLMTTYAALLEFGPDFRWPTRLLYDGRVRRGVVEGNVYVKAYGDPTLDTRDLKAMVRRLKHIGIRHITGDLVIDRSFFAVGDRIHSDFDKNRFSEYNAMPDALMLNDHLCTIVVQPNEGNITVRKAHADPGYRLVNRIVPVKKACRGGFAWPRVTIHEEGDKPTVTVWGPLSTRCSTRRILRVLSHPYYAFASTLKEEMARQGIAFDGRLRLGQVPPGTKGLMTHFSMPLIRILAKTDKRSNNLYARHLFLLLGAKEFGAPATLEKGRRAVRKILGRRGIIGAETILDNGCGLSRRTRTTARALHRLLEDAYRRYGRRWMEVLSVAGKDGTLRRRFRGSVAKGRAWMKTGTLKNAKNIAGYVKGRSGRLYTVVILCNDPRRWLGSQLENRIVEWIVRSK